MAAKKKNKKTTSKSQYSESKKKGNSSASTAILVLIVVALIGGGIYLMNRGSGDNGGTEGGGNKYAMVANAQLDTNDDPIEGSKTAPVVLHEYADFQCPSCAQLDPILREIVQTFGEDVALIYDNFPLVQNHKNAFRTSTAGECAYDQDKFWEMHHIMYENQDKWSESGEIDTFLKGYAEETELDVDKFMKCLDSTDAKQRVNKDLAQAQALNLSSTPSLFMNNSLLFFANKDDLFRQIQEAVDANKAASGEENDGGSAAGTVEEGSGVVPEANE